MGEERPTLPSEIAKEEIPYYLTASQTTAHLAAEVAERQGVVPVTYRWEDLSDEVKRLVKKVWKLEELTPDELQKLPYEEYARYLFDPRTRFKKPEALDGVRVLEVCRPDWFSFGLQFCGSLLAEHGAEVIKIEDPMRGDAMRWCGPPVEQGGAMKAKGENWPPHGTSLMGFCENRNKHCITLDLTKDKGKALFRDLARVSDIVIENYDPGYLDSLGIGYRQLRKVNPRLIYCAVTGYGQWGEESWRKTFETGIQAMSTLSSFCGPINYQAETYEEARKDSVPTRVGWPIGFISGGLAAALAVVGALLYRERKSGRGQMIDVSSEGLIIRSCDCSFDWYSLSGIVRGPMGNWDLEICPYGLHPCKGGRYSVVAGMGRLWWAICDAIGTEDSQILKYAFPDNPVRLLWVPQKEINTEIDKWTMQHEMDELMEIGFRGGFAAGGVYNIKEICEHDHFLDRGGIIEVDDPLYGKLLIQGTKPALSETPGRIKWVSRPMGWDNETIFRKYLGIQSNELRQLEKEGVISPRGGPKKGKGMGLPTEWAGLHYNHEKLGGDLELLVLKHQQGNDLTPEEEDALSYDEWCRYVFDPTKAKRKPKMLDGIRVVDWTTMIFGPFSCAVLAELGAEVIKIELPGRADTMRYSGPPADLGGYVKWTAEKSSAMPEGILGENVTEERLPEIGSGLGYLDCAKNKLLASIDIHPGPGQDIFKNLITKADVFVENVRTGTTDNWGISYRHLQRINPRLVYLAENGPGQWGRSDLIRASYDILGQSMGGSAYITGHPDGEQLKVPIWVCDYFAGHMGALGVLMALYWREKSGKGQIVEQSQIECMTRWLGPGIAWYSKTGIVQERYGNRHRWVCPDGIVKTKDGYVAIGADDEAFAKLCAVIGGAAEELPKKYPTNVDRVPEPVQDKIYKMIEDWTATLTSAEIEVLAREYGFGACPIKNAMDACTDKHYQERGEIEDIDDPWYGKMKIQGCVPLYSETPARTEYVGKPVGWDTEYILRRFCGLTTEQILELERHHIIGKVAGAEGSRDYWQLDESAPTR